MRRRSLLAVLLLASAAPACGPAPITVPSEQPAPTTAPSESARPATPGPTPTTSSSPSAAPPSPIAGNVLAAPGAIVIAKIEQRSAAVWSLKLDVVQRDASIASGVVDFGVPAGWEPQTQMGRVRLTPDGWAAIAIIASDELADEGNAIAVINVLGAGAASDAILGTTATWLPGGTLLVSYDGEEVIRRIDDHGSGEVRDLPDEQAAPVPVWRHGWVVEGDLSGIVAWERGYGEPPYLTLQWDGGVEPRPATKSTYLAVGTERLAGVDGAQTRDHRTCHFNDPCPRNWRRRGGELLAIPGIPADLAWTRDGEGLVVLDFEGPRVVLVRDDGEGLVVERLDAALPPDAMPSAIQWIGGMSDWAAVIEQDADRLTIVPLDGSPAIGPLDGWLAAVNP